MSRLLLSRLTNQLGPYPRDDDEPVVGLNRNETYVMEVVREPKPEIYDPAAFALQPLEPVIFIIDPNGNDANGTVTYGWKLVALSPPPAPNWDLFSLTALADPGLNLAVLAADSTAPNAARGLSAALLEAKLKGEYVNFAACWRNVVAAAQLPPEAVAALVDLARACHLPEGFIAVILPPS